jgi:competence ComEA-like helix-hairpin-helix protein
MCCAIVVAHSACVKLPRRIVSPGAQVTHSFPSVEVSPHISLNNASREELEKLPGIGPALAARIFEHRERYGRFRRAEHLLLVRGISERRFRQLRPYVTVE